MAPSTLAATVPSAPTLAGSPPTVSVNAPIGTCGLYALWWEYDVMVEANANYQVDWAREDALLQALGA